MTPTRRLEATGAFVLNSELRDNLLACSFVRAHDFMSAAPQAHSNADAERAGPIIEEVHDEEQPGGGVTVSNG